MAEANRDGFGPANGAETTAARCRASKTLATARTPGDSVNEGEAGEADEGTAVEAARGMAL